MFVSLTDVIQLLVGGITKGSIYSLVAVGFDIIFRATGAISFATGEQVVLGGLLVVTLATVLELPLVAAFLSGRLS